MSLNEFEISEKLVPANYLKLAQAALKCRDRALRELLEKRKLPDLGWTDTQIEALVHQLAALDSNNFEHNVGLGEREARVACRLVARRHYNFGHGIGRSGDLLEPQPKAAGSTLLASLTNALLLDLIHVMGVRSCRRCFLVPMATGMTLTLCLLALKKQRPLAKYVLWSRIDQKSCFKSITAAGLTPIIIDTRYEQDSKTLNTDVPAFEATVKQYKAANILCLYTTTSCFAPRNCDDVSSIAKLAKQHDIPHLVNNAYGLQSTFLTHQLEQAHHNGRVDLFVQSTDKNLLVPVGGAIVAAFEDEILHSVASTYAGRASSSATLDVFMTLLSLGKHGYQQLIKTRKTNFEYLRHNMQVFAEEHGACVPHTKDNPISLALTLNALASNQTASSKQLTEFGSMLYTRGVSGVRVVPMGVDKLIDGYLFRNWSAHKMTYNVPYLTVAAALGVERAEIDVFFKKLESCWKEYTRKQ